MVKRTSHSVDIVSPDLYDKLKDAADQEGVSVRLFVNNLLQNISKTKEVFAKMFPNLEFLTVKNGIAYIEDHEKNRTAKVILSKDKFECSICDENIVCNHIAYTIGNRLWDN